MNVLGPSSERERLPLLDLFRVALALLVFMFHSRMHIGCDYGLLNPFVEMGAIAMTGFYILSGFSLFYAYPTISNPFRFYVKRLASIYPAYIAVGLVAILVDIILHPTVEQTLKHIVQLPIFVLGFSTVFTTLFNLTPNGGLWFVSCLFFCYALYPWISCSIVRMNERQCLFVAGVSAFILLYSPVAAKVLALASIYSNPFFRILEFTIGVILARCFLHRFRYRSNLSLSFGGIFVVCLVLLTGVSVLKVCRIAPANYMFYSCIALPCFSLLVVLSAFSYKGKFLRGGGYLGQISYAFFLSQFFVWRIFRLCARHFPCLNINNAKIVFSLVVCVMLTLAIYHLVQIPAKKYLSRWYMAT